MRRNTCVNLLFVLLLLFFGKTQAQLSISSISRTYTQDFNTLALSGYPNTQSGGIFSAGWSFLEAGSSANANYSAWMISSTVGDTYSFGIAGVNTIDDRAFGVLQSSSLTSILGFKFTNNTGSTVTSITIGYTGEVWKKNSGGDNLAFSYQVGNVNLNTTTGWIPVPALSFTTPITGTSGNIDGNANSNRTVINPVTISGLNILNGATVTMRWVDVTASASAAMGIDDFTILLEGSAPAPPPANDNCLNAISLTPAASPAIVTGTLASATPTNGLATSAAKNDVWYKFTAPCSGSDSVVVSYTSAAGVNIDFEVFAGSCPITGAGMITAATTSNPESKSAPYTGSSDYYIRVIDAGSISAVNFSIAVFMVAPNLSGATINGSSTPCPGSTISYSLSAPVNGASYSWSLPGPDWMGSSTGNSISMTAGSTAGNIAVTAKDGCGLTSNPLVKAITPIAYPLNVTGIGVIAGNGQLTVSWTSPANCYDELVVVATDNSNVTLVPSGNGLQYIDTTEYASQNKNNSANMNPGEYCIYKGSGDAIVITGLLNSSTYQVKVFTRSGTQWSSGIQVPGTPQAVFAGAYRSVTSGAWMNNTTWQKYNGSAWVATSGSSDYPNNYTSDVFILSPHVVQLNTNFTGPVAVKNLVVESKAQLLTGDQDATGRKNKYIAVFGNITCNGTIGNANPGALDNICFGIEGAIVNIDGTGSFSCARIRKNFDSYTTGAANTTELNINMNINLLWSGTALYNNAANGTNTSFNVTVHANDTVTLRNSTGSVGIDGITGNNSNSNSGGKFLINGTLFIPGTLYLKTDNNATGVPCAFEIGSTGTVYTNAIEASASGSAGNSLIINDGGLLRITDAAGFKNYAAANNTINLLAGSTVEYAAAGSQQVLAGQAYSNLTVSGSGEKVFTSNANTTTINGTLNINANNTLALNGTTIYLNGMMRGAGSFTGSATSRIVVGPNTSPPTLSSLGVLRFTPGSRRLSVLTIDRNMPANNYPGQSYWAAVLGSDLTVDTLNLKQGILATDKHLLTLLSYPVNGYATLNKASYIATTDTLATAFPLINSFDGSYGFRISGVKANTDAYFPVGADFISPNRVMVNLGNGAATRDLTVMLTKGDIGYTGSPRVNRIWYVKSSVDDSVNARVQLYYTAYSLYDHPYLTKQEELETGFTGMSVRLVEKEVLTDRYFTNIANAATDLRFNPSNNGETYAQYTTASTIDNGTHPGIYKFNIFSIVDGDNVVLPLHFTDLHAYLRGNAVCVNWSVSDEAGIDHYELERAGDGRLFNTIAVNKIQHTSGAANNYSATDIKPERGANYYRIKAVGKDGRVLYSMVTNVVVSISGKTSFQVYPNPVKSRLCYVALNNMNTGTYNISIYNIAGQLVYARQVEHTGSSSSYTLYLPKSIAAGVYVVKLTGVRASMQASVFVSGK